VYATSRSAQPDPPRDPRIVPLILDVGDDTSLAAAAQAATDVSILVNNAGTSLATPALEAPLSAIRAQASLMHVGPDLRVAENAPLETTWTRPEWKRRPAPRRGSPFAVKP
jgi:NAD(P)-dependent dehydrogenase (short-subunit alcohol dehydrogenase family)